jgi:hypothetical protein
MIVGYARLLQDEDKKIRIKSLFHPLPQPAGDISADLKSQNRLTI